MLPGAVVQPLVAHIGHVGEQHLQHHFLAFDRTRAVDQHLQACGGGAAATWGQGTFTGDLDHAGAAIAVGAQAVFEAQVRNIDAVALRGFENGFAF